MANPLSAHLDETLGVDEAGRYGLTPELLASASGFSAQAIAGETISSPRVVRVLDLVDGVPRVVLARPPENEARTPLGITIQAGLSGASIRVATGGLVSDDSWSWAPGQPVLLGLDGTLVQAQPEGLDVLLVVGQAVSFRSLVVRFGQPIKLAPEG